MTWGLAAWGDKPPGWMPALVGPPAPSYSVPSPTQVYSAAPPRPDYGAISPAQSYSATSPTN